ncbi:MAG: low specificity L-threonine aldolase [Bacteroidales bacterium]
MKAFASDNWAGVAPEIMKALNDANFEHCPAYGEDDPYVKKAIDAFKKEFGDSIEVFFVYNGTGANVLSVQNCISSFHSIITPETCHMNVDETGAPEKVTGSKINAISTPEGKLRPSDIDCFVPNIGVMHHSQPKIVSISQVTELGTLYSIEEIKALSEKAHKHGMYLHMDGARLANAAVALGKEFREFTVDAGVDVLSFSGTKNGLMFGEAVVFFKPELAKDFLYYRKQCLQLHSKMRFIAAQYEAYLTQRLWEKNAKQANGMANLLAKGIEALPGFELIQNVDSNGVFFKMPAYLIPKLQELSFFWVWNHQRSEVRLMCAFDTTKEEVEVFLEETRKLL